MYSYYVVIHEHMAVESAPVKEIFIDAIYNISKISNHPYTVVSQEFGYGISLGFMLIEIHPKKDIKSKKYINEALECNKNLGKLQM